MEIYHLSGVNDVIVSIIYCACECIFSFFPLQIFICFTINYISRCFVFCNILFRFNVAFLLLVLFATMKTKLFPCTERSKFWDCCQSPPSRSRDWDWDKADIVSTTWDWGSWITKNGPIPWTFLIHCL